METARNKHQEDSTHGEEGDYDLKAMILSSGLQEGLTESKVFLNALPKVHYGTPWTNLKWT